MCEKDKPPFWNPISTKGNIISKLDFPTVILVILTPIFLYLVIDTITIYRENQRNLEEEKDLSGKEVEVAVDGKTYKAVIK